MDDDKTSSLTKGFHKARQFATKCTSPLRQAAREDPVTIRNGAILAVTILLAAGLAGGMSGSAGSESDGGSDWHTIREVELNIYPRTMTVAGVPYEAWTFEGTVPGKTIRAHVGDTLRVTIHNSHTHAHSFHPHLEHYDFECDGASMAAPFPFFPGQQDATGRAVTEYTGTTNLLGGETGPPLGINPIGPYKPHDGNDFIVEPGESKTCDYKVTRPGAYLYHCHMFPVERHVHGGQYGVIIVYPEGWTWEEHTPHGDWGNTKADVVDAEGNEYTEEVVALSEVDMTHLSEYALVPTTGPVGKVFVANFRAWNDPMIVGPVPTGENLRVIVTNIGGEHHSWHVHGHYFDVIDKASEDQRSIQTLDTLLISPGETYITQMEAGKPGFWFIHDHINPNAYAGRVPWLEITETEGDTR